MEETIHAWMTQNKEDVEKIGLKVIDIRKEFASLNIGGYFIQLIIPPAFHNPCLKNLKYGSNFMAISLEKLEDEALMKALMALNEKLEQVRIGPDCLTNVLDNIMQVFGYYKCSKSAMRKLAEGARMQCEEAFCKSEKHSNLESILPWCSVSVDPSSETVIMEIETKGIMSSKHVARALGFCLDCPLIISLSVSHLSTKEVFVDSFGYIQVSMKQTLHQNPQIEASMKTLMDQLDDEKLMNAVSRCCRARISEYGLETLVTNLVKDFFDNCSKRENRADRTGQVAESDNILVRLLIDIGTYLKNMSNWCVVCRKELPLFSRWCWCDAELCLFKFEEMGTGASILQELQNSELIELELSLAADATTSDRDVFEPYPPFLLETQETRKRSGIFSDYPSGENIEFLMATISMEPEISRELGINNYLLNKKLQLLHSIIDSFPPVAEMQKCTTDIALMQKLGASWLKHQYDSNKLKVDEFSEEDYAVNVRLPYNVLRYVLYTNRLLMNLLQEDFRLDLPGSLYQFAVFYNSEREQSFKYRRETEGSIFAFHGSASRNWYSIIRNGLRCLSITDYTSSGTAYGEGIHLSTNMDDTCSYSSPLSGWSNGKLKEYGIVAICEIFSGQRHFVGKSNLVVPPENENDIAIRYLIVYKHEYDETGSITITTSNKLSRETNFYEHFQELRNYYSENNEGLIQRHQHFDLLKKRRPSKRPS